MTEIDNARLAKAAFFLRVAIATAYHSTVASRLELWPANMGGSNWQQFLEYTAELNPWAPLSLVPYLGLAATIAEAGLGIVLLVGFRERLAGMLSCLLLLTFAVSMIVGSGRKSPYDYSVFTASAASITLAVISRSAWSLDGMLARDVSRPPTSGVRNDAVA
jgi:uncharacterized membrane protein YphA (DoxX/SURF4 family)